MDIIYHMDDEEMILWFWSVGALFTGGLLDPYDKKSLWWFIKIFFTWPIELGKYIAKRGENDKRD